MELKKNSEKQKNNLLSVVTTKSFKRKNHELHIYVINGRSQQKEVEESN